MMDTNTLRSESKQQKVRAVKSCVSCRKKKIKCDQEKPVCGTCFKKNIDCHYQEQEWSIKGSESLSFVNPIRAAPPQNNHKKQQMKYEGMIPSIKVKQYKVPPNLQQTSSAKPTEKAALKQKTTEELDAQQINFYSNTFSSPIGLSQGVLTWVSLLKKDRFMNAIALSHRYKSIIEKENQLRKNVETDDNVDTFLSKWNKETDPSFERVKEFDLFTEIENTLSNSKLIWISINYFFESEHYLLFPYVDKDEFVEKLIKLIGLPNYKPAPATVKINKAIDLSIIGILLIILRFVSTSVYNFGKPIAANPTTQFILMNPIPASVYNVISKIHQEISTIKTPSLQIFQFIGMKLSFELFSPEEYDCLNIANCGKLGELIQYGIQCSLNRDPDQQNTSMLGKTDKEKNLSRRLWYMIIFFDLLKFINVGYPPLIDETFYDTKLPQIETSSTEFEYIINNWIVERMHVYDRIRGVLKLVLNIKVKPTVKQIKDSLTPLLNGLEKMDSIDKIMKLPCDSLLERCTNFRKLMVLLQSYALLFTIYYHFFIFYCERQSNENSIHYLLELIKITKILYKPLLFMDSNVPEYNLHKHLGSATLSFPKMELCFHKISQIFFTILSRIKGLKLLKGSKIDPEILKIVDEMSTLLNNGFSYIMTQYINASDVYYHTWILSKAQVAIAFKILRIPKGPLIVNDKLTEEDINFKESLDKTVNSGDLGFETYTAEDLKKILNELKGLEEIFNYSINHPSQTHQSNPGMMASHNRKRKLSLNPDLISENDKKWFERMIHEFGEDDDKKHFLTSPHYHYPNLKVPPLSELHSKKKAKLQSTQPQKEHTNKSMPKIDHSPSSIEQEFLNASPVTSSSSNSVDYIADLNDLINPVGFDEVFNFSLDNFFGFNDKNGNSYSM